MYKYKNIKLVSNINEADFVTHSGNFHIDDVISTIFLSKIFEQVNLIRVPSTENINLENKFVYDIGYGEFDHHQKNRNGKRDNGIYYATIGLLWKKFGKEYLRKLKVKYIDKTFEYMDKELIQYIDATDNLQFEYLASKVVPDYIKYCNPEWNEDISINEAFIKSLRLMDEFFEIYLKHAISEVEAIEIILEKTNNCDMNYVVFDRELPYRKAIKFLNNDRVKYFIFKSRREGYDVRAVGNGINFKDEITKVEEIGKIREIANNQDIIYVDVNGKLCCTGSLDGAIRLIEYNEK